MNRGSSPGFCMEDFSRLKDPRIFQSKKIEKVLIITAYLEGFTHYLDKSQSANKCEILSLIKSRLNTFEYDFVIAADGGMHIADELGIKVNLIIGDFDSQNILDVKKTNIEQLPVEKDITDMQAALNKSLDLGATSVCILGGIGGRLDHTLGNIDNLAFYGKSFDEIFMIDSSNYITVQYPSTKEYSSNLGKHFSVFSHSPISKGVTYRGAYYPMENGSLTKDFPIGVSNSFKDDKITVSFEEGCLLIVISNNK